jgi:hypothetical protein
VAAFIFQQPNRFRLIAKTCGNEFRHQSVLNPDSFAGRYAWVHASPLVDGSLHGKDISKEKQKSVINASGLCPEKIMDGDLQKCLDCAIQ